MADLRCQALSCSLRRIPNMHFFSALFSLRPEPFLPLDKEDTLLNINYEQGTISERDTEMHDRTKAKHVIVGLIALVALLFTIGASRFSDPQSNGRFQLVLRHADSSDIFVVDTVTGQIWTNKYSAPDEAKRVLYGPKLYQDQ
ncbi:MAG: hypothetical protein ACYSWO_08195 [Planctomycetota bacterium]